MVTAGVGDLPCFTAFLFFGPYSNLKFIIFTYTFTMMLSQLLLLKHFIELWHGGP